MGKQLESTQEGKKVCSKCLQEKPISFFYTSFNYQLGRDYTITKCNDCRTKERKPSTRSNKELTAELVSTRAILWKAIEAYECKDKKRLFQAMQDGVKLFHRPGKKSEAKNV